MRLNVFQPHAFVAVETMVKRNDLQVASQIYRIARAYDESKERGREEGRKRKEEEMKRIVEFVVRVLVLCKQ